MTISNHDLFHLLQQKSRHIKKILNIQLTNHDLYMAQWSILYCLHKFGPMTQKEILIYLNVEAPTLTRTIARVEDNGWIVRREGEDKRERIIELTETAIEKFSSIKELIGEKEAELLRQFSTEEKVQLYTLLQKITPIGK